MDLGDLILFLRNRTVEAQQAEDQPTLKELFVTFSFIQDAIEASGDTTYWQVVDDLYDGIRHIGLADFKVHIPSEEMIRALQRK